MMYRQWERKQVCKIYFGGVTWYGGWAIKAQERFRLIGMFLFANFPTLKALPATTRLERCRERGA